MDLNDGAVITGYFHLDSYPLLASSQHVSATVILPIEDYLSEQSALVKLFLGCLQHFLANKLIWKKNKGKAREMIQSRLRYTY